MVHQLHPDQAYLSAVPKAVAHLHRPGSLARHRRLCSAHDLAGCRNFQAVHVDRRIGVQQGSEQASGKLVEEFDQTVLGNSG